MLFNGAMKINGRLCKWALLFKHPLKKWKIQTVNDLTLFYFDLYDVYFLT